MLTALVVTQKHSKAGEAFAATDQAVEIYHRLAAANPAAHEPDLARLAVKHRRIPRDQSGSNR